MDPESALHRVLDPVVTAKMQAQHALRDAYLDDWFKELDLEVLRTNLDMSEETMEAFCATQYGKLFLLNFTLAVQGAQQLFGSLTNQVGPILNDHTMQIKNLKAHLSGQAGPRLIVPPGMSGVPDLNGPARQ